MEFNEDYTEVRMEPKELRHIINGKTETRRCPDCQGTGEQWVLHYTLSDTLKEIEEFKYVEPGFAQSFVVDDHPEYSWGECFIYDCDECKGVGYITIQEFH